MGRAARMAISSLTSIDGVPRCPSQDGIGGRGHPIQRFRFLPGPSHLIERHCFFEFARPVFRH
jgi:hypothetical protein